MRDNSIAIIAMVEDSAQKEANLSLAQTQAANVTQSTELQEAQLTTKTNNINQNNYDDKQKSYQPNNLNGQYPSWNNNSMQKHEQEPIAPMFPLKGINSLLIMSKEKFDWDQSEQGQIQGAFFFGYILFQIPGARMAESVGAHWIIMVATFGSALISLAFPLSTQLNSIYLLMLLRFVMGLCQSAFFPASYVLFCRWLPEGERSVLLPVMFIGSNIGSISTYIMSAYLIRFNYGWPSVFYLSGLICLLVGGAWAMLGSSGPEDNWLITDEERRFILCNVNNQSSESNSIDERLSDCDEDSEGEKDQQQQDDSLNADDKQEKITFKGLAQEAVKFKLEQLNNNTNVDLNNNNISKPIHSSCQDVVISTSTHCVDTGRVLHKFCSSQAINNNTNNQCNKLHHNSHQLITRHQIAPEPCWPKLLKSIPVWTLILSMYGNEWSNVVLCYELPTYLNTALGYPIERNGVINSFFQFTYAVASPIMSSLGASMLARRTFGMHKIHVRKLFQSLATFGQMSCFLGIAICGLNVDLIILLMFASIVFRACSNAGDIMVAGDLSPGEYDQPRRL